MESLCVKLALWTLIASFLSTYCWGENILFFFAGGSYSHKNSAWPWASEMANRGHNVTFLSPFEKQPSSNSNIIDLTSKMLHQLMSASYDVDRFQIRSDSLEKRFLQGYTKITLDICETILFKSKTDPVLQMLLDKDLKFDLVVVNLIFGECGWGLAHRYGAKTIGFDASVPLPWFYDLYGIGDSMTWIPDLLSKYDNVPLSFMDRMENVFCPLRWYYERINIMHPTMTSFMKEAFKMDNFPSYLELEQNASLIFINTHPSADFAYSLPPFIINVGGMQTYLPEKPIPKVYEEFMNKAGPQGVVLISFGSTIRLEKVPRHYIKLFFDLIKKHKEVKFLLRWRGPLPDGYENRLDNLLASDWLPQRELLRHPKMRAFITHGGLNSVQEATFYGIPLIVLPLFADQDYNAYRVEAQNVGFRLEIKDLDFNMMDEALSEILYNNRYQKNMEVKSKIFRDRPESPLESVVFWTEFVLRNDDTSALKPMNRHQNWIQRRLLDVYFICTTILISIMLVIYFVAGKLMNMFFQQKIVEVKVKRS